MSNDKSDDEDFFSSFKKAYKEERNKVEKDDAPLIEQITEGFAAGVAETAVHPFRWFRSVIKKS